MRRASCTTRPEHTRIHSCWLPSALPLHSIPFLFRFSIRVPERNGFGACGCCTNRCCNKIDRQQCSNILDQNVIFDRFSARFNASICYALVSSVHRICIQGLSISLSLTLSHTHTHTHEHTLKFAFVSVGNSIDGAQRPANQYLVCAATPAEIRSQWIDNYI